MPRPQFTLRALLVAMLIVGAFFGGVEFGRLEGKRYFESERAKLLIEARNLAEEWRKGQERDANAWPTAPQGKESP